ncbi:hypothetical protein SAMN02799624_05308 [Paenibacillus sp. UNC496MF]|uniref:hypothetical protein n=1 Tax=Paenibacillus sp. UNC496MF TaxID=1502753 RepID=UPI0008E79016|nr:hypothetical protein [Paenibacillus sp. UNC496MF]SFJ63909.1 hypothetical protein SAMN02799624_05308 [Paenibacillus sp. UNC496MF]
MANLVQAQAIFTELLGKYEGAEQMRNAQFGGMYRENNAAAHQTKLSFDKQFKDAVAANKPADMQSTFDALLKKFEGADHMRNFAASTRYIEDEKITKETVKAFKARFAAAMA